MSAECLYIFVNQDPITDPYGWIQNLCARTGYELGPVGSSYWLIRLDSIYDRNRYHDPIYEKIKSVIGSQSKGKLQCERNEQSR